MPENRNEQPPLGVPSPEDVNISTSPKVEVNSTPVTQYPEINPTVSPADKPEKQVGHVAKNRGRRGKSGGKGKEVNSEILPSDHVTIEEAEKARTEVVIAIEEVERSSMKQREKDAELIPLRQQVLAIDKRIEILKQENASGVANQENTSDVPTPPAPEVAPGFVSGLTKKEEGDLIQIFNNPKFRAQFHDIFERVNRVVTEAASDLGVLDLSEETLAELKKDVFGTLRSRVVGIQDDALNFLYRLFIDEAKENVGGNVVQPPVSVPTPEEPKTPEVLPTLESIFQKGKDEFFRTPSGVRFITKYLFFGINNNGQNEDNFQKNVEDLEEFKTEFLKNPILQGWPNDISLSGLNEVELNELFEMLSHEAQTRAQERRDVIDGVFSSIKDNPDVIDAFLELSISLRDAGDTDEIQKKLYEFNGKWIDNNFASPNSFYCDGVEPSLLINKNEWVVLNILLSRHAWRMAHDEVDFLAEDASVEPSLSPHRGFDESKHGEGKESFYNREVKKALTGERDALVAAREVSRKAGVRSGDIARIEKLYKEECARREQEWKSSHPTAPFNVNQIDTFTVRHDVIDTYLKQSWNKNFISLQRGRFWTEKGRSEAALALQDYFQKQDAYDRAKRVLAQELWDKKVADTEDDFDTQKVLAAARVELFTALLIDERGELERLAHEQLPPRERNMFFAALDTWRSIPLWARLSLTTAVATGVVFAATPTIGAVGLAGYAGSRLVRGLTSAVLANTASGYVGSLANSTTERLHRTALDNFSRSLTETEIDSFDDFLNKKQLHVNEIFKGVETMKNLDTAVKILTGLVVGVLATSGTSYAQHGLEQALKPADAYLDTHFGSSAISPSTDHGVVPKPSGENTHDIPKSGATDPTSTNKPVGSEQLPTPAKPGDIGKDNIKPTTSVAAKEVFTGPKVLKELEAVEKTAKPLSNYFADHKIEAKHFDKLHELATVGRGGSAWRAVYDQLEYAVKNKLVDPRDLGIKLSNLDVENPVKLRHALDARVLEILKEDGYLRDGVDVRIARPGVSLDLKIGTDAKEGVHVFIKQPEVPIGQKPVFYNYEENRTSVPTPAHEIPKTRFAVVPQNETIPLDESPRATADSLVQRPALDPEFAKHSVPISKADIDVVRNSSEALSGELNKNRIFSSLPDSAPSLSPRVMLEVIHAQPSQAQAVDMFLSRLKFDDRFVESKWPLFEHMSVGEFSTHINSLQLLREAERSALFGSRATPVSFRLDLRTDFIGRSASIEIPADTRMYLLADFMATQKNLIEASANVRGQSLAQFLLNRATR